MRKKNPWVRKAVVAWIWAGAMGAAAAAEPKALSPTALVFSPDHRQLYVACATANQIAVVDPGQGKIVQRIELPGAPSGLVISGDGDRLYVTCAAVWSRICVIDPGAGRIIREYAAGYGAVGPVLDSAGKRLYYCNRFNNEVAGLELESGRVLFRTAVLREPISAALNKEGTRLWVANHLPAGRFDSAAMAASVSVLDAQTGLVIKHLKLPNGSGTMRELGVSPDGKWAAVVHVLARFNLPTTQVDRGWMNSNALTLIDLERLEVFNTVLLDNVDSGAANPWGVAWTDDGQFICVTHAGTHELSLIRAPALLEKLARVPVQPDPNQASDYNVVSRSVADVPNDLAFLVGLRQRIKLPGNGPHGLALAGKQVYIANYYSDSIVTLNVEDSMPKVAVWALTNSAEMPVVRRGEMLFNDATLCFQGWQSCASCHSSDARVDGLNWDLLNDGIGNPKNVRSLLLAHQTPPSMSLGVRDRAETAVRAGIRFSLFTVQPEQDAAAIDAYLKSLRPMPSPLLVEGKLSESAERGRKLFNDEVVGCTQCHTPGLFTNLKPYDVGTVGPYDRSSDYFDTPTLVELWRTAPYLHDGSAETVLEVLTTKNIGDRHGKTSQLTQEQIADLAAYVLSL